MGRPVKSGGDQKAVQLMTTIGKEECAALDRHVAWLTVESAGTQDRPPSRSSVLRSALREYLARRPQETVE
jgi:hypothetical protein